MTHDLTSLDSTIALVNGTDDITEEHAKACAEAMAALPVEAFKDAATRLTQETTSQRERLNRLNILMAKLPAWNSACAAYAKWKETQSPTDK